MRRVPPPPNVKRNPIGGPRTTPNIPSPPVFMNQQSPSNQSQNIIASQSVVNQMSFQQKVEAIKPPQIQTDLKSQIKTQQTNEKQRNQQSSNELKNQKISKDSVIQKKEQPIEQTVRQQRNSQNTLRRTPPPPNTGRKNVSQQKRRLNPPRMPLIPNQMQSMQKRQEEEIVTTVTQIQSGLVIQSCKQLRNVYTKKSIETSQAIPIVSLEEEYKQKSQKQTEKQADQIKEQPTTKKLPPTASKLPAKKIGPLIKPPNLVKPIQGNTQLDIYGNANQENTDSRDKNEVEDVDAKIKNMHVQSQTKQDYIQPIKTQTSTLMKNTSLLPTKSSSIPHKRQGQEQLLSLQKDQGVTMKTTIQEHPAIEQQEESAKNIPSQYNYLQQKLRKLEQLRSRIDESSQESYPNHNDQIQEEEEMQPNDEDQQEKAQIYIVQERDLNTNEPQPQIPQKSPLEEYALGQTNYDQMEIKDEHQQQHQIQAQTAKQQARNIQPPSLSHNHLELQLQHNQTHTLSSEEDSLIPIPAETVFESNLSIQQTRRQYLPDQISNSPRDSEQSMAKHHYLAQQAGSNIVYHTENHHSQANVGQKYPDLENMQQDYIHEQLCDGDISEKSDGQLTKSKHQKHKNQHHHKGKNQSIKSVYNQSSKDIIESENKQNQLSDLIPKLTESQLLKNKQNNIGQNIQQILRQFNTRKSQYFNNLENLKRKEENYQSEEEKHRQRIHALMEQVNHKNLLILSHANEPNDQIQISDRQMDTQEL